MSYSKKIYKLDSKERVRVLHVYTNGAELIQESGLVEGQLVKHKSTCIAKNVGRANETNAEEQAVLEAQAKVKKKLRKEYFETVEAAETETVILPMLAEDAILDELVYPVAGQPKLDGVRAFLKEPDAFFSRENVQIKTMGHILDELNNKVWDMLDGELYVHGKTFQQNTKLIKKDRGETTREVKYHVYDIIDANAPFSERIVRAANLVKYFKNIEIVPTKILKNRAELDAFHDENISKGFEGTIIRILESGYEINKRSKNLLRRKDFKDLAAEIINVVPSEKDPKLGVVECKIAAGTFRCGMKFSHKERAQILIDKDDYIGKMGEIRFFEYTDGGLPRFPVCFGIRMDK